MSDLRRLRQTEERLQDLAAHVEGELPDGMLFALVCFTGGPHGGYCAYVSNAQAEDMAQALEEAATRIRERTSSGPFADVEELGFRLNRHQRRQQARRDTKRRKG